MIQVIVSPNYDTFVLCRDFPKSTGFISTFKEGNNTFTSGVEVPLHRKYRAQQVYDLSPSICSYCQTSMDAIAFDCIKPIHTHTDIFSNDKKMSSGLIHFDVITSIIEHNGEQVSCSNINPRMLIKKRLEPKQNIIKISPSNFVPRDDKKSLKVFALILIKGFMLSIVDKFGFYLSMTVTSPKDKVIGVCLNNLDNQKMVNTINNMWPIFSIYRNSKIITVKLKDEIELDHQDKYPKLYRFYRPMDIKDEAFVTYEGDAIYFK